ncbi:MAG: glycerophosphodiester phosphodiesterase [Solirubrobacteraceae bacterium]|jgi:glycerophosphoryl diester phosphodiesterase
MIRVGHKGADAIAPGNTLASFDAALDAGVEMIEFDVLAERRDGSGELFVAHDHRKLRAVQAPTLAAVLAHLSSPPFAGTLLQLDLKQSGYEQRVLDALTAAGALERSFISTTLWRSLQRLRRIAPELRIGWTVSAPPGVARVPLVARLYSALLARRAGERLRRGEVDALVAEWRLLTPALVDAVRSAGGEIYVWTVDDVGEIRRLAALGVTGVITNDPRLFAQSADRAA